MRKAYTGVRTSNLEPALSVTVNRITVISNLESEKWTAVVQLVRRGSKNKRRQTKNVS